MKLFNAMQNIINGIEPYWVWGEGRFYWCPSWHLVWQWIINEAQPKRQIKGKRPCSVSYGGDPEI